MHDIQQVLGNSSVATTEKCHAHLVAVKEGSFLTAMQRIVGRVQIEDRLNWSLGVPRCP